MFYSCFTQRQNDTISYTNTIRASPAGEVITRQKRIEIIVKCIMENNSTVEVMYITEKDVEQNTSALGRYNLSMSFYESDSFSSPILSSPYYVDLNQTLYAQVSLHSSDADLLVFVDTCIASPNSDFGSSNYDLVRSGWVMQLFDNNYTLILCGANRKMVMFLPISLCIWRSQGNVYCSLFLHIILRTLQAKIEVLKCFILNGYLNVVGVSEMW